MSGTKDGVQLLVTFAHGLLGAFIDLMFTLGTMFAVIGATIYLANQSAANKAPGHSQGVGKPIAWLLLCGSLAGLDQVISAGARQLGWQGASFEAISYVDVGTFGVAADGVNAVLTLIRMLGVMFALQGVLSWRRSLKEGHTGLSAGDDVAKGTIKFIIGVMCVCNPYLLDALQKSFGLL